MSPVLAILTLAPPPLWISATTLATLDPTEAAARPYVVVPAPIVDDPKVAVLRRAGARIVLSFGLYSFGPDVKEKPTEWFAQNLWGIDKPQRSGETLTLDHDDALAYQIERAKAFAARTAEFVGVVVSVDLRTDQYSFRYAQADRARAVAATGLDPVDYDDPLEYRNQGVERTLMPPKLLDFMLKDGPARARRVVQTLTAPFVAAKKSVVLRVDPGLLGAGNERHVVAYGDWTTMLDLPGLRELWVPSAAYDKVGNVMAELQKRRVPTLRLAVFGAAKDLPANDPRVGAIELRS